MTFVKICGTKTLPDARAAIAAGADLLGLNFHPPSPRYLTPEDAAQLVKSLRTEYGTSCPPIIGIFVEHTVLDITRIMDESGINAAQLTDEKASAAAIEKLYDRAYVTIRPRDETEARELTRRYHQKRTLSDPLPAILIDAYHPHLFGGTGEVTSLTIAAASMTESDRVMLAGGLTASNVGERLQKLQPWGVDVASGVETSPGQKDATLMRDFVTVVHGNRAKDAPSAR